MSKPVVNELADGRKARSERSRVAIIDAVLELMEAGILVPTAQQISEQAGVGMRTFFRHFEDMESLFVAIDDHTRASYEAVFIGGDRSGSLVVRLEHAVEHHAAAYEKLRMMTLATMAQLWRSKVLKKNFARAQKNLRKDLDQWLPELSELPKPDREAVDAIASFQMWHRLREDQGLSKKASIEVVSGLLKRIIIPS